MELYCFQTCCGSAVYCIIIIWPDWTFFKNVLVAKQFPNRKKILTGGGRSWGEDEGMELVVGKNGVVEEAREGGTSPVKTLC